MATLKWEHDTWLVVAANPSEKNMEFVSWDGYSHYMEK